MTVPVGVGVGGGGVVTIRRMKCGLDWLNEYLSTPVSADEAADLLTRHGFPVEDRDEVALPGGGTGMMLDVEVTSNRGDCLSHLGLAREVAAATGASLQLPDISEATPGGDDASALAQVEVRDRSLCPLYTARIITGVSVKPSPAWLVDRLASVGLRSVNNVVDVTNFVLMESGQPLHAFDLDRLAEHRIVVRPAEKGEVFIAIDGTKHTLDPRTLVIADAEMPQAVAGVMGGQGSEVTHDTKNILLESAIFAPLSVRNTARRLKLASDSSYRFERGVDPENVDRASRRAAALIVELAGGVLAPGVLQEGAAESDGDDISLRPERTAALLGIDIPVERQAEMLESLGIRCRSDDGVLRCRPPSHRLDLRREVDLIEEVARLHGLDSIPVDEHLRVRTRPAQPAVQARRVIGRTLQAHGYHEAVTFSFLSREHGEAFATADEPGVTLSDDRRKAEPMLRPSLLPSLLSCRKANQDAGNRGVKLFEIASSWSGSASGDSGGEGSTKGIVERRRLSLLRDAADRPEAMRELRGAVTELIAALAGGEAAKAVAFDPIDHPIFDAAAGVEIRGQAVGVVGVVSDSVQKRFDLQTPVAAAELELEPLIAAYPPRPGIAPLPRFPAIERDLSVVVTADTPWAAIDAAIGEVRPPLLESVEFLGTYRGKPIPSGSKSVSLRLMFRDPGRTLRHDEVDPQVASVIDALKQRMNAELRG